MSERVCKVLDGLWSNLLSQLWSVHDIVQIGPVRVIRWSQSSSFNLRYSLVKYSIMARYLIEVGGVNSLLDSVDEFVTSLQFNWWIGLYRRWKIIDSWLLWRLKVLWYTCRYFCTCASYLRWNILFHPFLGSTTTTTTSVIQAWCSKRWIVFQHWFTSPLCRFDNVLAQTHCAIVVT